MIKPSMRLLRIFLFGALCSILCGTGSEQALAQAATKAIALSDRYIIRVPNDWTPELLDDGSTAIYGSGWAVFVYAPDVLAQNIERPAAIDAVETLRIAFPLYFNERPPVARSIEQVMIEGREAALYRTQQPIEGEDFDFHLYAVQLSDKNWGTVLFVGAPGVLNSQAGTAERILESFDVEAGILRAERAEARGLNPCFVSVDAENAARLRVGPGENRTAVAFLPAGGTFDVTGRFEDDAGNIWYQLIKAEAAPQSAAAEIWVLADEVESQGDCDVIGQADAPPVIPILNAPPAQLSGGESVVESAPAVTGIIPVSGFYGVDFLTANVDISCQGTTSAQIPASEVFSGGIANTLTVLSGGAQIDFGGDIWTRAGDTYAGDVQFAPGSEIPNGVVFLTATRTTELRGTLTSNYTIDGVPCSYTVPIRLRRQ
ncbi:MAG: hypothetical protein SF162_03690 [bacterium]|nr:hypothetical protein [bacterium]